MTNSIYLDNAASTPVDPAVVARLVEVMAMVWGNPSAAHPQGVAARQVIARARGQLLAALGDGDGDPLGDAIWTSGCTEADALAVLGAAAAGPGDVVLSTIEHPAVTQNARRLAAEGRKVIEVAPRRDGRLDPEEVAAQAGNARVVCLVAVQNEVGAVQPFAEVAAAVKARAPGCHVHLDAAQAMGKVALDVGQLAVDSVALAAHKFHGPPGVGALWVRRGAELRPLWGGGGQQRGLRSGTQNTPGAAGLGLAAELAEMRRADHGAQWRGFSRRIRAILDERGASPAWQLDEAHSAPHILALAFSRVTAEAVRNTLASRGVLISTGSACAARGGQHPRGGDDVHDKGSTTLAALGLTEDMAMVRLSFGHQTTLAEVETAAGRLAQVVRELAG
jgi:cysteine desulfurase